MNEIKEIRKIAGLTQQQLSEMVGIPKRTVESWEGGKRTPPEYVLKLLKYFVEHEILKKDSE